MLPVALVASRAGTTAGACIGGPRRSNTSAAGNSLWWTASKGITSATFKERTHRSSTYPSCRARIIIDSPRMHASHLPRGRGRPVPAWWQRPRSCRSVCRRTTANTTSVTYVRRVVRDERRRHWQQRGMRRRWWVGRRCPGTTPPTGGQGINSRPSCAVVGAITRLRRCRGNGGQPLKEMTATAILGITCVIGGVSSMT